APIGPWAPGGSRPTAEAGSRFSRRREVADQRGVPAKIADQSGGPGVSIKSMQQRGTGAAARLIFVTHSAREADLRATVHALRDVDVVHRVGSVLRVLGDED